MASKKTKLTEVPPPEVAPFPRTAPRRATTVKAETKASPEISPLLSSRNGSAVAEQTAVAAVEKSSVPDVSQPRMEWDSIATRAYFRWLERGCPEGSPEQDWLEAERELSGV